MRYALLVTLLMTGLAGCRSAARNDDLAASLDRLFRDLVERHHVSGAVVVSQHGKIVFEGGYGFADRERAIPFTPDTATDAASITKTFTADLVLRLARDGVVDLDAPVQRYLSEFPYAQVTLRRLLSHSSGLPSDYGYFDAFFVPGQPRTTEALLTILSRERPPLAFEPGTQFEYCSLGYDVAAFVAAHVQNTTVASSFHDRFFAPLELTSAYLRPARLADFPGVRTKGYAWSGGTWILNEVFEDEAFHGGSNLYLSTRDLDRWNAYLLGEPQPPEALQRARIGDRTSGLSYGSWYQANSGDLAWYAGHLQGFHTRLVRERSSGISIVYTTNSTIAAWLQPAIIRAVRDVLAGKEPEPLVVPEVTALARTDLAEVSGTWTLSDGSMLTTEVRNDALFVREEGVTYPAFPAGSGFYYVPGQDLWLAYRRSDRALLVSDILRAVTATR